MLAYIGAVSSLAVGRIGFQHGRIEPVHDGNWPEAFVIGVAMVYPSVCSVEQEVDERMAMGGLTFCSVVGGEQEKTDEGQCPEDP